MSPQPALFLVALAQMVAATDDPELRRRLDLMVAELAECQRANGNGYVGGIPHGRQVWAGVAAGRIEVDAFRLNGAWAPWYNLHKTAAGLRDAWLIARNAQAREVLVELADWCDRLAANLSDAQIQTMLRAEHGGINEVLADVYGITGETRYLGLAKRFSHHATLYPLLRREDRLTGQHANTQIAKVVGFARIAGLEENGRGGDVTPAWGDAARFFWETVVTRRSAAIGGDSVREHFQPAEDFSSMMESREGPETCNTYNLLRLIELLFARDPAARYAGFYERALFSHVLFTPHPDHGGFVYFTSLRPRDYRVYSQPGECFWCCVGTGMENHGKHGRFPYAHAGADDLLVNLFVASELHWRERGVRLRQETRFPDEERTRLVFSMLHPQRFRLRVRRPGWVAAGALTVCLNREPMPSTSSEPSSYLTLDREWRDGDVVEIGLPMLTTAERLPDGSPFVALLRGPIVLAAKTGAEDLAGLVAGEGRMAHLGAGALLPLDGAVAQEKGKVKVRDRA